MAPTTLPARGDGQVILVVNTLFLTAHYFGLKECLPRLQIGIVIEARAFMPHNTKPA